MMIENEFVVRCLRCGQKNRIPKDRLAGKPLCGRCGKRLDELILRCLACGTRNIVGEDRLHDRPICGKCGVPLYQGHAVDVTDTSFDNEVAAFPGPVLVYCWAPWFKSTKTLLPVIHRLAPKYAGGVKLAKLNIYENPAMVAQYHIENMPTLLLFKHGTLIKTVTDKITKESIEHHIRSIIKDE